jgi:hypothetical protein
MVEEGLQFHELVRSNVLRTANFKIGLRADPSLSAIAAARMVIKETQEETFSNIALNPYIGAEEWGWEFPRVPTNRASSMPTL